MPESFESGGHQVIYWGPDEPRVYLCTDCLLAEMADKAELSEGADGWLGDA